MDVSQSFTGNQAPNARLIGAHMPTAGGIVNSLTTGQAIGCSAVQVFTCSPRQWNSPDLSPEVAAQFRQTQRELGIEFTVAHDSYLINLCAPDAAILERSCGAFRKELDRAEALGIPWVVTHMGAHLNSGEEAAIELLCASMQNALRETDGMRAGILMETTAGQGSCLGHRFEHLARVMEGCGAPERLGVCLDTCHIFVAGYDIRDDEGYKRTMAEFDRLIGFDRLKVIHANDAKKPLGSKVDRHEHIGRGEIGIDAFRRLVTDPRLIQIPIIVETPDAETMHEVNVARLRSLAAGSDLAMRIQVHLFGHFRDLHRDPIAIEVTEGASVGDLAEAVVRHDPRLDGMARICRAAVNEEYAANDQPLHDGDEVAFIPPMSGG